MRVLAAPPPWEHGGWPCMRPMAFCVFPLSRSPRSKSMVNGFVFPVSSCVLSPEPPSWEHGAWPLIHPVVLCVILPRARPPPRRMAGGLRCTLRAPCFPAQPPCSKYGGWHLAQRVSSCAFPPSRPRYAEGLRTHLTSSHIFPPSRHVSYAPGVFPNRPRFETVRRVYISGHVPADIPSSDHGVWPHAPVSSCAFPRSCPPRSIAGGLLCTP